MDVSKDPGGKLNPPLNIDKNTEFSFVISKKLTKLSLKFQAMPGLFPSSVPISATPSGMAAIVAITIPHIMAPFIL